MKRLCFLALILVPVFFSIAFAADTSPRKIRIAVMEFPPMGAIAPVWMFIGIIWFAGLTATLSSALTVNRIRQGEIADLSDLYGKKVAVIDGTTSEDFLRYHNVKMVLENSLDDLLANLKEGRSEAVVYDAPPLMYAAKLDPTIKVVGSMFANQRYGIVFPNTGEEELREIFDFGIMISQENGEYQKIYNKWF